MKTNWKTDIRMYWSSQATDHMVFTVMRDPDLRAIWNISDEQYQQLKDCEDNIDNTRQNDPEYQKLQKEIQAMINPDDPFPLNADKETLNKWQEMEERGTAWMLNYYSTGIRSILTPEQQHKVQEIHWANIENYPIVSPYLFEALGLTDAQKQQMEEIRKELEPEFEKNLDDFANGQLFLVNMMYDELEKLGVKDIDGMNKELSAVRRILAESPEYKRIMNEAPSKSKQFSEQFKTRLYDVLTDEQLARLQKLISNPPEHVQVFRKKFNKLSSESEEAKKKPDVWTPGPDSWKPGDPIPEQYRQQRNKRQGSFPRGESE
jgi:Spy/CpxP family protein refolding chaperone